MGRYRPGIPTVKDAIQAVSLIQMARYFYLNSHKVFYTYRPNNINH
jgi:hypothetical protein